MLVHASHMPETPVGISLIDGDAAVRRERQLMLRSEAFEVRSYATCAAILADRGARTSSCLVADADMPEMRGVELVRLMRARGWRGSAILLAGLGVGNELGGVELEAGDIWLPKTIGDRPLLDAVRATLGDQLASGD
jgi:FixJ family two-component response regulator